MRTKNYHLWILFLLLSGIALAGCSVAEGPKRIAVFPPGGSRPDTERYIPPPYPGSITYNAEIEIEVSNPDAAADRGVELAAEFGGYLVSSTSWTQGGERTYRMVFAVPSFNFDGLREALVSLGDVMQESVWGEKNRYGTGEAYQFSSITLQIFPGEGFWRSMQIGGWEPLGTFRRAFGVFVTIFGFVVDILIWVVVILGPFLLVGWLVWALVRKNRLNRRELPEADSDQ